GLLFLTMTAIAAFMRAPIMDLALDPNLKALPEWARHLTSAGLAKVPGDTFPVALQSFTLNRDYVLLALPTATGLPGTIVYLVAAALVAAALACAGATVANLANILAEDIVNGLTWEPPVDGARLLLARALLLLAMAGVAAVSLLTPSDPLRLMHWALVVTAATAFPVLILSIWWKRLNGFGAVAGMATGFALAVGAITAGETGLLETPGPLVAAAGLPAGAIVAMIVAVLTPAPSRHALELVRDIRVPGGEILYDREMQRLRLKHRRAGG
ncbi:MAG: sodium:solute symporter, partial [Hyphomicrobiaceae bacterium]